MTPRATLRLQFHRDFTFADAQRLVPYLARLGISHLYASPIATARPGSRHGYDVLDPTAVNPELGGEEALRALAAALAEAGLGLVIDIVPNHMAADPRNAWWRDVLRHGRASRHAAWFDIDWQADDRVLLPLLGRPLDEAVAAGELQVDAGAGVLRYFETALPLAEGTAALPLVDLLAAQHWRLAWWRTASDRINWRRFFDINELVCLRVEEPDCFEAVHALPLRLYREGVVGGLRVDHVDGLTDPAAYCRRLRERLGDGGWLVVEKILLRGERLAVDWRCDGTTGYDFMNDASALQHDETGEAALAEAWARLSARPAGFAVEEEAARREILARSFSAQLDACALAFAGGELAATTLRRVLTELLVHFPVYRTYGVEGRLSAEDRAVLAAAAAGARRSALASDRWAIEPVLALFERPDKARAIARFQQLSAPVAAKSVEDTAFYRYGRLLSRNDVGFDVETFSLSPEQFHARVAARAADHPAALLATATHDHKRGEDVRARLAVLSEMAIEWAGLQARWTAVLQRVAGGAGPSAGDLAMLLQTVVGAWPLDLERGDAAGRAAYAERLAAWQEKALRESKLGSDWAAVDEGYEAAARDLLLRLVARDEVPGVLDEIAALVARIAPAGAVNGLAQCLLRLTVPGVPDLYQGTEFWDFSLVDPDNRRPVDFAARARGLAETDLAPKLAHWADGRIKQVVIQRALALRARKPLLFEQGSYEPIRFGGEAERHVVGFVRAHGPDWLLVAVPRLPLALLEGRSRLQPGTLWQGAVATATGALPAGAAALDWLGPDLPVLLLTNRD
ncbi:MAG: malto-oligosyltrehalose synthase [Reyranellaceae bacterium]